MKHFAAVWKLLSIPVLLLAIWLGWWGTTHWSAASAQAQPITLQKLQGLQQAGVYLVRDSFEFDLSSPGLRQENHYGVKGPALAVFPVRALGDTAHDTSAVKPGSKPKPPPSRYAVVSAETRFVGPSVGTYLRADSMTIVDIRVSTSDSRLLGNIGPEMQALVQVTADQLGHAPLLLPNKGRAFIEGIATMHPGTDFPDLVNPAESVWEIRTGEQPGTASVALAFAGALALLGAFVGLNIVVKKFDREELEREVTEREEEKGLV